MWLKNAFGDRQCFELILRIRNVETSIWKKNSKLKEVTDNTVNKLSSHMIKISKIKNDFEAAIFFAGARFGDFRGTFTVP